MPEQVSPMMNNQGAHPTSKTKWNTEQIHVLILDNRRITIKEVSNHMQICHSSAYEIIQDRLHFHSLSKVSSEKTHRTQA